ncbi:24827_t:CDS:2, partial [Dentiscutata erythropus]
MNEFDQNFENYNSFNEYITKMEELEYSEMLSTDMQIFKINNPNIDSEEDIRIEDSIVEVEDTSSETSTRYSADIIQSIQPFSVVDEPSFRKLLNKLDPLFKIPKRQLIQNKILDTFIKQYYKLNVIISNFPGTVSITTDMWANIKIEKFYMKTAICNFIMSILNEFNLTQKVATITSDNGANVVKACHLIKAKLDSDEFTHYRCICYILNLAVGSRLKQ